MKIEKLTTASIQKFSEIQRAATSSQSLKVRAGVKAGAVYAAGY